jgi:hypothetical protein
MSYKLIIIAALLASPLSANASLYDRGNGLVYDDVLDITWLKDANYASTSNYTQDNDNGVTIKSNGRMDWFEASNWAGQLEYAGFSDWRLPTLAPQNGSEYNFDVTYDGSSDRTYNLTQPERELAYMYYVNLGNEAAFLPDGSNNPTASQLNINTSFANGGDTNDIVSFENFFAYLYWYDSLVMEFNNGNEYAWAMGTINGMQEIYLHSENPWTPINTYYAWAVHDGDIANVSAVPLPAASWLFLSALIALFSRRQIKSTGR